MNMILALGNSEQWDVTCLAASTSHSIHPSYPCSRLPLSLLWSGDDAKAAKDGGIEEDADLANEGGEEEAVQDDEVVETDDPKDVN